MHHVIIMHPCVNFKFQINSNLLVHTWSVTRFSNKIFRSSISNIFFQNLWIEIELVNGFNIFLLFKPIYQIQLKFKIVLNFENFKTRKLALWTFWNVLFVKIIFIKIFHQKPFFFYFYKNQKRKDRKSVV